jgi:thioredoxin 1
MEEIPELTDGEFSEYIKKGLVVIDFFAEWCMPCMMMAPILEDLKEEFNGKIKMGKINVEDFPKLANKFSISSIPAFIFFKDGEKVNQITGSRTQEELSNIIRDFI